MARYKAILFWMGGVLTDNLIDLVLSAAKPTATGHELISCRQELERQTTELIHGTLTPQAYCNFVVRKYQIEISGYKLEEQLIERIHLRSEVVEIIHKIPEEYDRWIISDYPTKWYKVVSDSLIAPTLFPTNRVIFSATNLSELCDYLPDFVGQKISSCLMIDGDSSRAVECVKRGLASVIYVYPDQLKHKLALLKILHTDFEVLHPYSSERVNTP